MPKTKQEFRKISFFLPNIFTAFNMACGFTSILLSIQGHFYYACIIIILGSLFDSVDGKIARVLGVESSFGEQFDSISDVISFGIAPAIILYLKFLNNFGRTGAIIAFIYLLCSALRLARFNTNVKQINPNYFQGLPTPAGAIAILGITLFITKYNFSNYTNYIVAIYSLLISFLMISNLSFISFKNEPRVKNNEKKFLFLIILTCALILINEKIMIFLVISLYITSCSMYNLIYRKKMLTVFDWTNDDTL